MRNVVGAVEIDAVPASVSVGGYSSHREGVVTHVGKRRFTIIPAGHGLAGKSFVSGYRVFMSCRHVYVSCGYLSASGLVDAVELPISMRNPYYRSANIWC